MYMCGLCAGWSRDCLGATRSRTRPVIYCHLSQQRFYFCFETFPLSTFVSVESALSIRCILGDTRIWVGDPSTSSCIASANRP